MTDERQQYLDMVPAEVPVIIAEVFEYGHKIKGYAKSTWQDESIFSHVIKAMGHLVKWMRSLHEEDHLACALWRVAIAATMVRRSQFTDCPRTIVAKIDL